MVAPCETLQLTIHERLNDGNGSNGNNRTNVIKHQIKWYCDTLLVFFSMFAHAYTRIHTFRSCSVHIRQSQSVLLNFCIWHPKLLVIIALRVVGQRHAQNSLFFFSLLRNVFYWKRKFNSSTEPNKSKPNRFNCITRNFVVAIVWNWMRTCAPRWLVFAAFFGLFCRFAFIFMKYEISLRAWLLMLTNHASN